MFDTGNYRADKWHRVGWLRKSENNIKADRAAKRKQRKKLKKSKIKPSRRKR